MTREQILTGIDTACAAHARPLRFIRGSCSCDECLEHEALMQSLDRDRLPLAPLNSPAWDPICFASNDALAWLLPGLVRLLLDHADDYVQQFVFHIEQTERMEFWSPQQARALRTVLDYLVVHHSTALENNLTADDLFRAREQLEAIGGAP